MGESEGKDEDTTVVRRDRREVQVRQALTTVSKPMEEISADFQPICDELKPL